MGSVCADQYQKFQLSHPFYLEKSLKDLEINSSPRNLLNRRAASAVAANLDHDMYLSDSPTKLEGTTTALFQKFLPYNNLDDDDDGDDPYSADHFRMYEFKVRRCNRSRSHDWTDCPFAHPGEKARRRDPRKFHYSGTVCSEFRKGSCSRGDNCEFAHGVFECWLHPARYRTEACKDGKNCKRKVCFFAHSPRQLRILPANRRETASPPSSLSAVTEKYHGINMSRCGGGIYCRSPTSTLMGISSSHVSPPLSPAASLSPPMSSARPPFCRCCGGVAAAAQAQVQLDAIGMMSHKDALTELFMNSLEAMKVKHQVNCHFLPAAIPPSMYIPSVNGVADQLQFSLSPTTPPAHIHNKFNFGTSDESPQRVTFDDTDGASGGNKYNNDGGLTGIDLGWVNDLLT